MGVPAFYRWLSQKYPKIVKDVIEEHPEWVEGEEVPVDTSTPNPNGIEFDNLYLDMNGIIHPCFHPEDRPAPTTETEVFENIFDYIDRLFSIIRPRKLIYMAIDGVAPRAKMNQQRSRRFRAAQDAEEKAKEEEKLRAELEAQGIKLPKAAKTETFDSNIITPGTAFMDRLATALQYYVHLRLNGDKGWRNVEVILSDSNVPGEGEHKAMQYIRQMRGRPGWNANTRHCVYGLDADLIMLALATHEPHFCILREVIFQQNNFDKQADDRARLQMSSQNNAAEGAGNAATFDPNAVQKHKPEVAKKPYQLLLVNVLREYLALEFKVANISFEWDQERVYDDFVFMCFFVGNDFLPHMPTLDIREGAIELMMRVYKQMLPQLDGYLTDGPNINWSRAEKFIQTVGRFEDTIFQKRVRELRRQRDRIQRQKEQNKRQRNAAGQQVRVDEAAPSARYFINDLLSGNVKSAKSTGRGNLNFKVDGAPPSAHTAAGMDLEIQRLEAEQKAKEAAGLGPFPRPASDTPAGPVPDNKSAAAALRARIGAKRTASDAVDVPASDNTDAVMTAAAEEATAQGDGVSPKRIRSEDAGDVSTAPHAHTDEQPAAGDQDMAAPEATPPAEDLATPPPGEGADVDDAAAVLDDDEEEEVPPEIIEPLLHDVLSAEEIAKNKEAADRLKKQLEDMMKEKADKFDQSFEEEVSKIRLDEEGWKQRYYQEKFGVPPSQQPDLVRNVVREYIRGLAWVMNYYYRGCVSWTWYFPYHYAPFASDLFDLQELEPEFELGEPFAPFNQLMGVFPAASSHALPKPFRWLFTDPQSPILDFYPKDFAVDMNGKRFAWQGVALLPFIDEERLLAATTPCLDELTDDEKRRNSKRMELLYVGASHPLAPIIYELEAQFGHVKDEIERAKTAMVSVTAEQGLGLSGTLLLGMGEVCPATLSAPSGLGEAITGNQVLCVNYRLPSELPHKSCIMPGTELEAPVLTELDMPYEETLWHEKGGPRDNNNRRYNPYQAGDAAQRTINSSLGMGRGGPGGYDNGGYGGRGNGYNDRGPGGYGGPRGGPPSGGRGYGGYNQESYQQQDYNNSRAPYGGRGGGGPPGGYGGRGGGFQPPGSYRDPRGAPPPGRDPRAPYGAGQGGYGSPPPAAGGFVPPGAMRPVSNAGPGGGGASFFGSMRQPAPGAGGYPGANPYQRPPGGGPGGYSGASYQGGYPGGGGGGRGGYTGPSRGGYSGGGGPGGGRGGYGGQQGPGYSRDPRGGPPPQDQQQQQPYGNNPYAALQRQPPYGRGR